MTQRRSLISIQDLTFYCDNNFINESKRPKKGRKVFWFDAVITRKKAEQGRFFFNNLDHHDHAIKKGDFKRMTRNLLLNGQFWPIKAHLADFFQTTKWPTTSLGPIFTS